MIEGCIIYVTKIEYFVGQSMFDLEFVTQTKAILTKTITQLDELHQSCLE